MARRTQAKSKFTLPPVAPGDWEGEIFGGGSVNLGQVVQPGPPRQSVEFSYIVLPASSPRFRWPGVVMIMAPTPMKTDVADAGVLFANKGLPSLHLSLDVTRAQFSDLLRLLEAQRFRTFRFTIEASKRENAWPVHSWGMGAELVPTAGRQAV